MDNQKAVRAIEEICQIVLQAGWDTLGHGDARNDVAQLVNMAWPEGYAAHHEQFEKVRAVATFIVGLDRDLAQKIAHQKNVQLRQFVKMGDDPARDLVAPYTTYGVPTVVAHVDSHDVIVGCTVER